MHLYCGPFEGQEAAFEQCTRHRPMEEIQGFAGSHWMPPLGDYSLHIAPAAARTTITHTMMNKYTYFAGRFDIPPAGAYQKTATPHLRLVQRWLK
jgi:hypothetical protein